VSQNEFVSFSENELKFGAISTDFTISSDFSSSCSIRGVCFVDSENFLSYSKKKVEIWNMRKKSVTLSLEFPDDYDISMCSFFNPDVNLIALRTGKNEIELWSLEPQECLDKFSPESSNVRVMGFLPKMNPTPPQPKPNRQKPTTKIPPKPKREKKVVHRRSGSLGSGVEIAVPASGTGLVASGKKILGRLTKRKRPTKNLPSPSSTSSLASKGLVKQNSQNSLWRGRGAGKPRHLPTRSMIDLNVPKTREKGLIIKTLEKDISSLQQQLQNANLENEKLRKKLETRDLSTCFTDLNKTLSNLNPTTFTVPEKASVDLLYASTPTRKSLVGEYKRANQIEKAIEESIGTLEAKVGVLQNDSSFGVFELFRVVHKNREAYVSAFRMQIAALERSKEQVHRTKRCMKINDDIVECLGKMKRSSDFLNGIKSMIKARFQAAFIQKKRSLDVELEQCANLVVTFEEDRGKLVGLLDELKSIFLEYPSVEKHFPDHHVKVSEVQGKWKSNQEFFGVVKTMNLHLKKLLEGSKLSQMQSGFAQIISTQKQRQEMHLRIERDFRELLLRNDKAIEKYQALNNQINSTIKKLLKFIQKQVKIFDAFVRSISEIDTSNEPDGEQFKDALISETMRSKDEVVMSIKEKLEATQNSNETYYGKIYEVEKSKVFGGLVGRKRKRLVYFGQMRNGKKDGIGKLFHEDQKTVKFYGRFVDGCKHGLGEEYDKKGQVLNKLESGRVELKIYDLPKLMEKVDPIKDLLGKGTFGEVYKLTIEDELYALKRLFLSNKNQDEILRFKNEVRLLSKLQHSNICHCFGWGEYEGEENVQFGLILEYCPRKLEFTAQSLTEKVKLLVQIGQF